MRLDRFDLNLLVVLDVLLEERNVTRASERLHIGQPAASGALARLREYFDDELLVPVGRRLELTPLARSLVQPVRDTLVQARSTLTRKAGFDAATASRRFVVCASDYVITVLLADLATRLASEAPGLALDFRCPPKDVLDVFERGSLDFLIMPARYVEALSATPVPLFSDTQVCMVWSGNTSVGDSCSIDDYLNAGHVALRLGDQLSLSFEEWVLPRSGVRRRVECSVDSFSTLPLLVLGTQRMVTLHRRLAARFAEKYPLRLVQPPFELAEVQETLVWPRHLDHDPAHAWLRERLRSEAARLLPAGGAQVSVTPSTREPS